MSPLCVIVSSCVPIGIRGAMNQWMLEVLPGVYVGRLSARIRELLWVELSNSLTQVEGAYAAMIRQEGGAEQGYTIETVGEHRYEVQDFGGLALITHVHRLDDRWDPLQGLPDPSW